jgi:hypothetical protein
MIFHNSYSLEITAKNVKKMFALFAELTHSQEIRPCFIGKVFSVINGGTIAANQILAELGEKVKADSRNGVYGQLANDAHMQGVVATVVIGLLIACENANSSKPSCPICWISVG